MLEHRGDGGGVGQAGQLDSPLKVLFFFNGCQRSPDIQISQASSTVKFFNRDTGEKIQQHQLLPALPDIGLAAPL